MRTDTITIDRKSYLLAHGESAEKLQQQVLDSIKAGGGIVRFIEVGNREVHAIVSPGVPVTFESVERQVDDRDDGDITHPFDPDLYF